MQLVTHSGTDAFSFSRSGQVKPGVLMALVAVALIGLVIWSFQMGGSGRPERETAPVKSVSTPTSSAPVTPPPSVRKPKALPPRPITPVAAAFKKLESEEERLKYFRREVALTQPEDTQSLIWAAARDPKPAIRHEALVMLQAEPSEDFVREVVVEMMQDPDPSVSDLAFTKLTERDEGTRVELLKKITDSDNAVVAKRSVQELGAYGRGNKSAVEALVGIAATQSANVIPETVINALNLATGQKFSNAGQAVEWWKVNGPLRDESMGPVDVPAK